MMRNVVRSWMWLVAAVLVLPFAAHAQDQTWDGTLDIDNLNGPGLLNNVLVDASSDDAEFEAGEDLETDVDYGVTAEAGIDEYAELKLVEYVLATPAAIGHAEVLAAYTATYPIVDRGIKGTQLAIIGNLRRQGNELVTALMIRNKTLTVAVADGFDAVWSAGDLALMQEPKDGSDKNMLTATGDLDGDGVTNKEEWDATAGKAIPGGQNVPFTTQYLARVQAFVVNASAGSQEVVSVSSAGNVTTIAQGKYLQLSAGSTDVTDGFTWASADNAIATVDANGLAHGVGVGSVKITATGTVSGAKGNFILTVRDAEWTDNCSYADTFEAQGPTMAGAFSAVDDNTFPPGTTTYANVDADFDSVADSWQLHHLAYALCQGNVDYQADYDANKAALQGSVAQLGAYVAYLGTVTGPLNNIALVLANPAYATTVDNPAVLFSGPAAPYLAPYQAAFGVGTPVHVAFAGTSAALADTASDFGPVVAIVGTIVDILAGEAGLSTPAKGLISGLFPISDINTANTGISTLKLIAGSIVAPTLNAFGQVADAGTVAAQAALITTGPAVAAPALVVIGGAKLVGEPFSGPDDYDGDGDTNVTIANDVENANGDEDDYVAGVTGELGPFWTGNEALPVGGMLGLGAALSALSASGVLALRRKQK